MAIEKPEWFKLDAAKFLTDTLVDSMSALELGACMRLLCRQWIDGYIPDDLRLLARLCRLDDVAMVDAWVTLSKFFPPLEPGKRANRFMGLEREKVIAALERKSDEGTRAARKRWDDVKKSNAEPNGSPMPQPMQDQTRPEQTRADGDDVADKPHPAPFNPTEVAQILCQRIGCSGQDVIWAFSEAIKFQAKKMPDVSLEEIGEQLVAAWVAHKAENGKYAGSVEKFFAGGKYVDVGTKVKTPAVNPAELARRQQEGIYD